jgi:septal ring-binding cell division protein DamX
MGTRSPAPAIAAVPAPMPASPVSAAPAAAPGPAATLATVAPAAAPAAPASPPASPADSLGARLAAGRTLIADNDAPGYAVQLLVTDARDRTYLENYLAEAAKGVERERLYVVPAGPSESPRLGVLVGGFRERADALAALAALPENLKQFRPYVRNLEAVRDDARRAAPR